MKYVHQKAFTLIELIFIIVVIGILSIVAIPKLAATRSDATAAKCTQEVQQLLAEITQNYTYEGYSLFAVKPIEKITNLRVGITKGDGISSSPDSLVEDGIIYRCSSEDIVLIKGTVGGTDYNLTVTDLNTAISPAAVTAAELIRKLHNISIAGGTKVYSLE